MPFWSFRGVSLSLNKQQTDNEDSGSRKLIQSSRTPQTTASLCLQYNCRGLNALWHLDSYDKRKPYGIAIKGCIDGFSHHIMWMEAYRTNSNPKVIADYFINTVIRIGGCLQWLRADPGTENGHIRDMQMFLRRNYTDHHAGDGSFIFKCSTANQRIESWWEI